MWPASALLTGNGVAFILRVPGTEHGDWWSMNGWWIFAGTSAVALLSKYLIQFRGRHIFNPSNFGLVPCFLLLGPERADPLAFWWGPLSPALVLALAVIVTGGFVILRRLHLTGIAVGFWLSFAAGIGCSPHRAHDDRGLARRADRGSGILVDARVVARDPRVPLLHDHRPADDPGEPGGPTGVRRRRRAARDAADRAVHDRVRDESRRARRALRRLRSAARPRRSRLDTCRSPTSDSRPSPGRRCGLRRSTGLRRPRRRSRTPARPGCGGLNRSSPGASRRHGARLAGVAEIDESTAQRIAATSSRISASRPTLCARRPRSAAGGALGEWLATLWQRIRGASGDALVPA